MLGATYLKAKALLENKQVRLISLGPIGMIFEAGNTPQMVIRRWNNEWSCSCAHFAIHCKEGCSHIRAAQGWLRGEDLEEPP